MSDEIEKLKAKISEHKKTDAGTDRYSTALQNAVGEMAKLKMKNNELLKEVERLNQQEVESRSTIMAKDNDVSSM